MTELIGAFGWLAALAALAVVGLVLGMLLVWGMCRTSALAERDALALERRLRIEAAAAERRRRRHTAEQEQLARLARSL